MVRATGPKVLVVLFLCYCVNFAVADRWGVHIHRRGDPTSRSIVATTASASLDSTASNQVSQKGGNSVLNEGDSSTTGASGNSTSEDVKPTSGSSSNSATPRTGPVVTQTITGFATASTMNPSAFNSTLTPGALPIIPIVTPGFGVAGAILMITGAVYTLVGIKNKQLHIFLSAAYLASLSVTVLIVYVMNLPVGNPVQGAYVVAATLTGLILGAGAIVFTDMTEGLGCLLGGFSLSMWLLSLKAGGLLTATSGKAIFISAFTLGVFATSFSHHTRPYGLIGSISFAGATVVVLGIDCFSKAGLKEFWAWIWALNPDLFPVGATTYPLTRAIRVEIAAIIVIFIMGVVSQMKLWKIIKERRERRETERLEDERVMEQEEENVGRRVEHLNAGERNQWEAVYGDKNQAVKTSAPSQRDSGVGDMESQRKRPTSIVTSARYSADNGIEMSGLPSPTQTAPVGLTIPDRGQEGSRVAHVQITGYPEASPVVVENGNSMEASQKQQSHMSLEEGKIWFLGANGEASQSLSNRISNPPPSVSVSQAPGVVALPFRVHESKIEDDRSSIEALAEEEEACPSKRPSNRLSAGSTILKRLSMRSLISPSPRNSKILSTVQGQSTEDLVIPYEVDRGYESSVAATIDGLSDEERSIRYSIDGGPGTDEARSGEFATPPLRDTQPEIAKLKTDTELPGEKEESGSTRMPEFDTATPSPRDTPAPTEIQVPENIEAPTKRQSLASSADSNVKAGLTKEPERVKSPTDTRSAASTSESRRASLTKDRLPAPLPRVAMSYRTNEWAKHLSSAEAPEADEMKLEQDLVEGQPSDTEISAPVNIEDLQQTAESSALALRPTTSLASRSIPNMNALSRSSSLQSLQSQSASNRFRVSSGPIIPQPIVEYPAEESFASPSPAPSNIYPAQNTPFGTTATLIGRRESMMRSKSYQANQFALPSTPELPTNLSSPYQSQYQSLTTSRAGSEAGSNYNYQNNISNLVFMEDDDNISLSARRELIRQSSLHQVHRTAGTLQQTSLPFDTHQPRRESSVPLTSAREQQLASFRASVRQEIQNTAVPKMGVERQRSALWQERQAEEQRRALEAWKRGYMETAFDERMRSGDMLDVHREALRKMQARASKNA